MNHISKFFILLFFIMAGYGFGTGKNLAGMVSIGMAMLVCYGERKFSEQDREWDRYQRIKQNLISTSEHMLGLHDCEVSGACVYNPSIGLQVHD